MLDHKLILNNQRIALTKFEVLYLVNGWACGIYRLSTLSNLHLVALVGGKILERTNQSYHNLSSLHLCTISLETSFFAIDGHGLTQFGYEGAHHMSQQPLKLRKDMTCISTKCIHYFNITRQLYFMGTLSKFTFGLAFSLIDHSRSSKGHPQT